MNENFPIPITTTNDLEVYEAYLKEEFQSTETPNSDLIEKLQGYIGKPVKAECEVGNRLESKSGILSQVGNGFIVVSSFQNRQSVLIGLKSIKFFTVLQNNTKNAYF